MMSPSTHNAPRPRAIVLGGGVIGLTTGIVLREAGVDAHILTERTSPDITSDRAAAFFHPYGFSTSGELRAWCSASYRLFAALESVPEAGVRQVRLREFHREAPTAPPWWSSLVREFAQFDSPPAPYAVEFRAMMPTIDMRRYLPWLDDRFTRELGGTITTARLDDLDDARLREAAVIVNCTGLGARPLTGDPHLIGIRGQVLHVENTIALTDCLLDDHDPIRPTYLVPFPDRIVLGGTAERHDHDERPNDDAIAAILARANELLVRAGHERLEGATLKEMRRLAGIRPARLDGNGHALVRVQREKRPDGRIIVHHYGHGGAGVTLSWGTAMTAAALAQRTLEERQSNLSLS